MNAPRPRPGILDITPYAGGESAVEGARRVIKLSSNESALGPSPAAAAAMADVSASAHRYPDGAHEDLRTALAARFGLNAERIVCGAGSDELISLLIRAYAGPGDEVLYSEHGFLMYAISARAAGAAPVTAPETNLTADVDALLAAVTMRTRMVFLANPNNPTGTLLADAEVRRLRAGLRGDVLLVLDAAYAEYVTRDDYDPGVNLVRETPNTVMTRTFSKLYGLAGVRLGWCYAPKDICAVLHRVRSPFNVSAAALAGGAAAAADTAFEEKVRAHTIKWRAWTAEALGALGLGVTESEANFLLVRFDDGGAEAGNGGRGARAADAFLKSRGIICRGVAAYGLPEHLRVTIGTEDEMRALAAALKEFME
ncbi:MAG: histidinol-phosphate transaminase [Rhodospirillales bacterium]